MFAKMHKVALAIIYGMPEQYKWMKINVILEVPNIEALWLQKPGEKRHSGFSILCSF